MVSRNNAVVYSDGVAVRVDIASGLSATFPNHPSRQDAYELAYAWAESRCDTVELITPRVVLGVLPGRREVEHWFQCSCDDLSATQRATIARSVYQDRPFDTALPAAFVRKALESGIDPGVLSVMVWGYATRFQPAGPLPLVREAVDLVRALAIAV